MNIDNLALIIPSIGILALLFTWWKTNQINALPEGTPKMAKIAASIREGAMAFLKAEYKILIVFVIAVAILLYWSGEKNPNSNGYVAISFIVGAFCSALAGYLGMVVATKANVRTTNAARESLGKALEVAFAGGSVMGLGVVGLGILGLGGLFAYFAQEFSAFEGGAALNTTLSVLTGFSSLSSTSAGFTVAVGDEFTLAILMLSCSF